MFVNLTLSRWRQEDRKFQVQPMVHGKTMGVGEKLTFRADPESHINKSKAWHCPQGKAEH